MLDISITSLPAAELGLFTITTSCLNCRVPDKASILKIIRLTLEAVHSLCLSRIRLTHVSIFTPAI